MDLTIDSRMREILQVMTRELASRFLLEMAPVPSNLATMRPQIHFETKHEASLGFPGDR